MKYHMNFHVCLHEECGVSVATGDFLIRVMFHSYSH